jgi:hypothetical protein
MDSGLSITGGMCGDARFEKTLAFMEDPKVRSGIDWWINIRVSVCQLRRMDSFGPSVSSLRQSKFCMKLMVNRR